MNEYGVFASFYDRLMEDADYAGRAEYLLSLLKLRRPEKSAGTVLDLACGSGSLTVELALRGLDVIGVDGSEDMLAAAAGKAAAAGVNPMLLCQDMRRLDLFGTVDAAVCAMDSLNHLCRTDDLRAVFRRLHLFLEPGGLFVFDVNTPYKHRAVLADNAFVFEQPDFLCVWQNRLLPRTAEVDMHLDFFVREAGDRECYRRLSDHVRERAYAERTLRELLKGAGFEVEAVYDDRSFEPPHPDSERVVYVARRK